MALEPTYEIINNLDLLANDNIYYKLSKHHNYWYPLLGLYHNNTLRFIKNKNPDMIFGRRISVLDNKALVVPNVPKINTKTIKKENMFRLTKQQDGIQNFEEFLFDIETIKNIERKRWGPDFAIRVTYNDAHHEMIDFLQNRAQRDFIFNILKKHPQIKTKIRPEILLHNDFCDMHGDYLGD